MQPVHHMTQAEREAFHALRYQVTRAVSLRHPHTPIPAPADFVAPDVVAHKPMHAVLAESLHDDPEVSAQVVELLGQCIHNGAKPLRNLALLIVDRVAYMHARKHASDYVDVGADA